MKVSVVTVVLNNRSHIEDCINSVLIQNYNNIEYIVIDGGSTDGTLDVIKKYEKSISRWISEPDQGIYDAMNKGISFASGDIVGILNSDDSYNGNEVLNDIVKEFSKKEIDSVFADLVYVDRDNPDKIVRYYKSDKFNPKRLAYGWIPAHPTFFIKRKYYYQYGLFRTNYKLAADYELLVRLLGKYKLSYSYLPKVIVKMRNHGASTISLRSNWTMFWENIRACRENDIETNVFKICSKYFTKIFQLVEKPNLS
jgi:glycosyltransferase involved in cell wall biosynthesis